LVYKNQLTKVRFVLRARYGKPVKVAVALIFIFMRLEIPLFSCTFV